MFGGTSKNSWECSRDLYKFRVSDNLWTLISPSGDSISARNSHTMVLHPGSSTMYVFGGWDNHRTFFNDIFALHSYGTRWSQVCVNGPCPVARMGHAAVIYRNSFLVIGGFDESQKLRNDVWEFSLCSMVWREHKPAGSAPIPRYRHTAIVLNDYIYVMGGTGDDKQRFNDVHVYDIRRETWYEIKNLTATCPAPRSFHQSVLVDGAMYVIGGMSGSMKLNDVYRLVTDSAKTPIVNHIRPVSNQIAYLPPAKLIPTPPIMTAEQMQKKITYLESKILCKVCFENEINCVLVPCSHRAVCMACASQIVNRDNPCCPICRVDITRVFPTIDA